MDLLKGFLDDRDCFRIPGPPSHGITHEPSCAVHHVYSHAHVDLSTPRLKFSLQDVPSKQGDPRRCTSLKIVPVSLALSFSLSLGTRLGESSFSLSSQLLSPFHIFRMLIEHVVVSLTPHLHHSRWIVRYFVCSTFLHDGIRRHFTFASAVSYGAFCTNVSEGFHNLRSSSCAVTLGLLVGMSTKYLTPVFASQSSPSSPARAAKRLLNMMQSATCLAMLPCVSSRVCAVILAYTSQAFSSLALTLKFFDAESQTRLTQQLILLS